MKFNNITPILKNIFKIVENPLSILNQIKINDVFQTIYDNLNNSKEKNIYSDSNISSEEFNESISAEDNSHSDNKKSESDYYINKHQDTSSNQEGIIDSIAQELTPVKLQQAIILSEIVGKPRSKTRRQRKRF